MKFILGQKLGMTQLWVGEERKAVTMVKVGPCKVLQVKNVATDGYEAIQLGFGRKSSKNLAKPQLGHAKGESFRWVREFRLDKPGKWGEKPSVAVGDQITAATVAVGDKLIMTALVKGRGFAGVVKRHGFHGHNATHGTKDQVRMPGSIGAGGVQHVFKGMRMAGRMGGNQVTSEVVVVAVDLEKQLICVEGGIPGSRGGLVKFYGAGTLTTELPVNQQPVDEPKQTIPAEEAVSEPEAAQSDEVAAAKSEPESVQ